MPQLNHDIRRQQKRAGKKRAEEASSNPAAWFRPTTVPVTQHTPPPGAGCHNSTRMTQARRHVCAARCLLGAVYNTHASVWRAGDLVKERFGIQACCP
jgi:hypothetical protein